MKKKRVCIDINSALPMLKKGYLTGIGRTTFELVQEIENLNQITNFDIVLYSQNTKNINSKELKFKSESKHLNLPYRDYVNKILSCIPIRTSISKADLWHCPHNSDYVDYPQKTVFTIHDMIIFNCQNEFSPQEVERVKREIPSLLQKSKAVITCSESSKNDIANFMQIDPNKIFVTYWGIKHDIFRPLSNTESIKFKIKEKFQIANPFFLSVSCGYKRKNTLNLIKSYLKFSNQQPKHDLVLIWNDYQNNISELENSPHKNKVHILKQINDFDLALLYNGATATFYISSYEGFGLPILESMACGTPIVTSPNSSLTEIGKDIPYYTEPNDEENITSIMESFENSSFDLSEIIARGIKHASTFTWDKCARRTLELYQLFLNNV